LTALVALPICGALCDRSRSRFGRRRLWLTAGALAFAVGLIVTGAQTSVTGVVVAWAASMIGLSAATAGLTAVIADRVPEDQRGMSSSAIYGPQALGVVVGITLVSVFGLSPMSGFAVIAVLLIVCLVPFLAAHRDIAFTVEAPLSIGELLASMGSSFRNREFAWAFGGRLLVNLANSLGTCYTLYFLSDGLKVPDPAGSLLVCTVLYLLAGLLATAAGVLSDRLGRRRIFVALAALLQAASGFLLASAPSLTVMMVASALMGGGFGAYMAVDQALITQVFPDAESRAKDLGIMNIGSVVPPAIAPLIAGAIISSEHGYPLLFALVGAAAAVGALLVYRIRSVR